MRIIGGKYRGKKLFTPVDLTVRPTSDRAREALFSILYSRIGGPEGARVLDVFAGTGAFGFEALSRGADKVAFIDINPDIVKKNARLFPEEEHKIEIFRADARRLRTCHHQYNIMFCDAPYGKNLTAPAISALSAGKWLANNALCLIETGRDEELCLSPEFVLSDERVYGAARIRIYYVRIEAK